MHEGEHFNLENEDVLQLLGFGTAAAKARPGQAVLSQALEQLLPVKFIKHNLFPLILIYFPIKRKHPIVPLPLPPTTPASTRKLKSWPARSKLGPEQQVPGVFFLPRLSRTKPQHPRVGGWWGVVLAGSTTG